MSTKIIQNTVRPGYHSSFNITHFNELERDVLKRLVKEFYLTNSGGTISQGKNSQYRFFLLKPTPEYGEQFNLDREIVCLFSPYSNFEPRTLEAFDDVLTKYQSLRTESICRLVISADKEVEAKIDDLIKQDPEQPIVVPFTHAELLSNLDPYFIKNRFAKHFYSRDLFSFFSPLHKDLYFFGRTDVIQEIVARHDSSENSGLFGLRKSGKTSIVYGLERFLSVRGGTFVTLDCQSPSIHKLRWYELLYKIVALVHKEKESKCKISGEQEYSEKNASDLFQMDMLKIYESKKRASSLIIFDEIERISPYTGASEHWKQGDDFVYFWQSIRAFFQRNRGVITYLLVGTNPKCIETSVFSSQDNPIFSQLPFQYVPPFDFDKTKEMVLKLGGYMGLDFDDYVIARLTDDFGGHPFLIRQVCSEIQKTVKARPLKIDKALYIDVVPKVIPGFGQYLSMIVEILEDYYPDEYEMLKMLAVGDTNHFKEFAGLGKFYTEHLSGYGLITHSGNGYSFNIESLKNYLLDKNKHKRLNLSNEEKEAEVSERRISLERNLRKILRNQLKANFGAKSAYDKLISALPENRRNSLANLSYDDLLVPTDSPLFLLELINLINREWEVFKNIFPSEKQKVIFMLEEINRLRKDPHSNSYPEDTFHDLRIYFSQLEKALYEWV